MHVKSMMLASILILGSTGCRVRAPAPGGLDIVRTAPDQVDESSSERPDGIPDDFSVDEVVAEVLRRNPAIRGSFQGVSAESEVAAQKIWPPFPMASYSPLVEPVETRLGPVRYSLAVQQAIPFPHKLSLRGDVATHQEEVARQSYLGLVNRVVEETRGAVYELAWVYEAIRITEETRDLLHHMEEVAREKYKVGKASQQDVLKAQVELAETENDLLALEDDRQSAMARLIALLDRPTSTAVGRPAPVEVREAIPDLETLYETARNTRPEIAASAAAVEREESSLTLRKEDYIPDFQFGAQYTEIGGGPDAWGLSFGLTLPLWVPKIRASVREGEKRLDASRARLREVENRTLFEVKDNHSRWLTATRLVKLYQDTLIPQAQQSYRAAEAGYQTGEVDFLNYLDSQRTLLNFRLAFERAKVEAQVRLAALERAVGQPF